MGNLKYISPRATPPWIKKVFVCPPLRTQIKQIFIVKKIFVIGAKKIIFKPGSPRGKKKRPLFGPFNYKDFFFVTNCFAKKCYTLIPESKKVK